MYPTEGINDVQGHNVQCTKVIENGHLVLVVGENRYTVLGQKIQ